MFRMPRDSFHTLCEHVVSKVGMSVFKPETSIQEKKTQIDTTEASMFFGGVLCGELKLAVTIRILAGASYLDLLASYNISTASVYSIFHQGIGWINTTFQFPLVDWLRNSNWPVLHKVSSGFGAASGDVFQGCFGAIDGLAIKIKCPPISETVPDPGNYFCRKGFYALNVQAIRDKSKRILWCSTGHKGATHDSVAYTETKLCMLLESLSAQLQEQGLFLVGDSAYPLLSYLMIPFPDAQSSTIEDAFNFWLSNSRIQIECAFGKLVLCV